MCNWGEIIHVQILLFQLRIHLNLLSPHMSITYMTLSSYVPIYLFMSVNKRDKISSFQPQATREKLNVNKTKMKFVCIVIFEIFLKKVSKGWLVFLNYNKTLKFISIHICVQSIYLLKGKIIFHITRLKQISYPTREKLYLLSHNFRAIDMTYNIVLFYPFYIYWNISKKYYILKSYKFSRFLHYETNILYWHNFLHSIYFIVFVWIEVFSHVIYMFLERID